MPVWIIWNWSFSETIGPFKLPVKCETDIRLQLAHSGLPNSWESDWVDEYVYTTLLVALSSASPPELWPHARGNLVFSEPHSNIQVLTLVGSTKAKGAPRIEYSLEIQQIFEGQGSLISIFKINYKLFACVEYCFLEYCLGILSSHWALDRILSFSHSTLLGPWGLPEHEMVTAMWNEGKWVFFWSCYRKSSGTCLPALSLIVLKSRWKFMTCVEGYRAIWEIQKKSQIPGVVAVTAWGTVLNDHLRVEGGGASLLPVSPLRAWSWGRWMESYGKKSVLLLFKLKRHSCFGSPATQSQFISFLPTDLTGLAFQFSMVLIPHSLPKFPSPWSHWGMGHFPIFSSSHILSETSVQNAKNI